VTELNAPTVQRRRVPRHQSSRLTEDQRPAGGAPAVMLVMGEPLRRTQLQKALRGRGLTVVVPAFADEPETLAAMQVADVVVLDVRTPWGDGLSLCVQLAAQGAPPLVLLMPDPDETDRIIGLELGADECLPASVSPRELTARVRALARRAGIQRGLEAHRRGTRFAFAGFTLCLKTRELRPPDGSPVFLAAAELSLLQALVENPREVLPRGRLRELVGAGGAGEGKRVIDWRINRLRKTLQDHGGGDLIKTVRRRGYVLVADVRVI
jgi:two-component system, OmpR family, response regulator